MRVEVGYFRVLFQPAVAAGVCLYGRAILRVHSEKKWGQISLPGGGACHRPTIGGLILWRLYKAHGSDFYSALNYTDDSKETAVEAGLTFATVAVQRGGQPKTGLN